MAEQIDAGSSSSPSAGTAISGTGTFAPDSTNAAIVIGAGAIPRAGRSPEFAQDAERFYERITRGGHPVPEANGQLLLEPTGRAVADAFRSLRSGAPFNIDGSSARHRLWIYVSGFGQRESSGSITLLLRDGSIDISSLVSQVVESGEFHEVIFIADVGLDTQTPAPADNEAPRFTKQLPPTIGYSYLIALSYRLDRNAGKRFIDFLLQGLEGAAANASGTITSRSLYEYVRREMTRTHPGRALISINESQEIPLSAPQQSTTEPGTPEDDDPAAEGDLIGTGLDTSREAGETELRLNVDRYARSMASLFLAARDGEFCFALYGHWGRGKTVFMNQVAKILSNDDNGYQVLRFSAWKYPTAPEVWVHLYEEFAESAKDGPWYRKFPIFVRTGMEKYGATSLLVAYFALAFSTLPVLELIEATGQFARAVYTVAGVMGLIWLVYFARSARKTYQRLRETYLSATRHTEKLGLQATIGADLKALLKGWMPKADFGWKIVSAYVAITAFLLASTWIRLTGGAGLQPFIDQFWHLQLSSSPGVVVAVLIFLSAAAGVVAYLVRSRSGLPNRVLLIVDDLDRCSPSHLLSVMESIKLLIEDPEISRRVQVAMLIEEEALRHAILVKYQGLLKLDDAGHSIDSARENIVVRENCEKLFVAHLRLPQLAVEEIKDLVMAFAAKEQSIAAHAAPPGADISAARVTNPGELEPPPDTSDTDPVTAPPPEVNVPTVGTTFGQTKTSETDSKRPVAPPVLSDDEIRALLEALDSTPHLRPNIGPRSIRALMFRYQLARLLLGELGVRWRPRTVAELLISRSITDASHKRAKPRPVSEVRTEEEKLARVIEQLC